MLLAIDVSNTTIKAGVFRGAEIAADWRFATDRSRLADEYGMLLLSLFQASGIAAADIKGRLDLVRRAAAQVGLRADVAALFQGRAVDRRPGIQIGLRLAIDNPKEVGADRIVNTLATHRLYVRAKPGRSSATEITLFKSLGLAIEDLAAAQHEYARAKAARAGAAVEF